MFALFALLTIASAEYIIGKAVEEGKIGLTEVYELNKCMNYVDGGNQKSMKFTKEGNMMYVTSYNGYNCNSQSGREGAEIPSVAQYVTQLPSHVAKLQRDYYSTNCQNSDNAIIYYLIPDTCINYDDYSAKFTLYDGYIKGQEYTGTGCKESNKVESSQVECGLCDAYSTSSEKLVCVPKGTDGGSSGNNGNNGKKSDGSAGLTILALLMIFTFIF